MQTSIAAATPTNPGAIAAPPPIAQWSILLSLSVAAIGWLGRRVWEAWDRKELEESSLNRSLVDDLRRNNDLILQDVRDAHSRLAEQLAIRQSLDRFQAEAQKVLGGQGLMVGELAGRIAELNQKVDRLTLLTQLLKQSQDLIEPKGQTSREAWLESVVKLVDRGE